MTFLRADDSVAFTQPLKARTIREARMLAHDTAKEQGLRWRFSSSPTPAIPSPTRPEASGVSVTCRVFVERHYIATETFDITTSSSTHGRALHRAQKLAIKAANKTHPDARPLANDQGWSLSYPERQPVEIERIGYPDAEPMTEVLPGVFYRGPRMPATAMRYRWRGHTFRSFAGLTKAVTKQIAKHLDDKTVTCAVTLDAKPGKTGAMRVDALRHGKIIERFSFATTTDERGGYRIGSALSE